jgi:hypothetical protein
MLIDLPLVDRRHGALQLELHRWKRAGPTSC